MTVLGNCSYSIIVKIFILLKILIDRSSYVDRMPKMGETMAALNFFATPGGKGANACTAGARLGSHNIFICKVINNLIP